MARASRHSPCCPCLSLPRIMKQYKFISRSALSFSVLHGGRQMYVNFSAAYRGLSFYITTDAVLAEKIRRHRWFRDGRITEQVVDMEEPKEEKPFEPTMPPAPKKYSILGKTMAPRPVAKPAVKTPEEMPVMEDQNPKDQESSQPFMAEEVTSFMEAKEFFITNYGVQRSDVSSKDAIAQLCKEFGVVFPNYLI